MTIPFSLILLAFLYFNSHPHEEDDSIGTMLWGANLYFNSHPHEEDDARPPVWSYLPLKYFNSHPHEEDDRNAETGNPRSIFQLTSSRRG